jgi:hypothetical protein
MTKFPELFAALAAPFGASEVKTKQGGGGRQLTYITARQAMNRLDMVLGPENWWDDYYPFGAHGVRCLLTIRLPDGSAVCKAGVGGVTEMHDPSDTDKTGESDALKRAAVKFGIARELYRDGSARFVGEGEVPNEPAHQPAPSPEKPRGQWGDGRPASSQPARPANGDDRQHDGPPRSGRALFAWSKKQEERSGVGLIKHLNSFGKLNEFPGRMVDWDEDQVAHAYAEAVRKLQAVGPKGDAYEGED